MELKRGLTILHVPLDEVQADPRPLDRAVMQSLATVGQLYPIIVMLERDAGKWEVWDGHTRVRAARELGWTEIKVLPAADAFEAARYTAAVSLAANLRASNPLAEGKLLAEMDDDDYAMQAGGLSRAEIASRRRLLNLRPEYQELVEDGRLALTAAKALAGLACDQQEAAYVHATALMEVHNEERRRAPREVPTVSEIDAGVRRVKASLQPAMPVPGAALPADRKQEGGTPPHDPVQVAQVCRAMAEYYAGKDKVLGTWLWETSRKLMDA